MHTYYIYGTSLDRNSWTQQAQQTPTSVAPSIDPKLSRPAQSG